MHRSAFRAILIALILAVGSFAVAALWQRRRQQRRLRAARLDGRRAAGKKIKVGLVTDIGGLNDRSFNALGQQGPQATPSPSSASRAAC